MRVPDGSPVVTLASSVTAEDVSASSSDVDYDDSLYDDDINMDQDEDSASTVYGSSANPSFTGADALTEDDAVIREVLRKRQLREVQAAPFSPMSLIEGKDFTDIFFTVIIPLGVGLYGLNWTYGRASTRLSEVADRMLQDYASELCYHTGDLEEMRLSHSDYKKRMAWLGPNKKKRMMETYLETFAKKVTVSPQSISSLSYVFSLYKLSEDKAAQSLSDLCLTMPERSASTGKLLFYGTSILKSQEARDKLDPIRSMLCEGYGDDADDTGGEGLFGKEILERSQRSMGVAAYRDAVVKGGKSQKELTPGWEVLGLTKERAQEVFDEEAELGFVSAMETKYSRANLKYDAKGKRLDPSTGKADVGEGGESDDSDDDDEEVKNVYECGECSYTLFIAKGRNEKFFGSGFVCPECGAPKDKFVGRMAGE